MSSSTSTTTTITTIEEIEERFKNVQSVISSFLVETSSQDYSEDLWDYEKGSGGGISRVWQQEDVDGAPLHLLEKSGVNFSGIQGSSMPDSAATQFKIPLNTPYHATGVSLVIHPRTPHIPTIHMNIRYFQCGDRWWFGGGVDLTPYYIDQDDEKRIAIFHRTLKGLCERWNQSYEDHKKHCDEYFVIKHRNEARGIGGLFFDHLSATQEHSKEQLMGFVEELGLIFPSLYGPFIESGRHKEVTPQQRDFHLYRRSRYVEFNLLYDRGTRFGLQSEGRIESILMSLPLLAKWKYNYKPEENTPEAALYKALIPRDWASLE